MTSREPLLGSNLNPCFENYRKELQQFINVVQFSEARFSRFFVSVWECVNTLLKGMLFC